MAVTPFIKPIENRTGAFYAFQTAINDSNLINSQENYKFTYSKYALLRLPDIGIPAPVGNSIESINKVQFGAIGDSTIINSQNKDYATLLAESFQNYCLNFESILLSQPNYISSNNRSVTERVFFKWLKEIGAIRFRNASNHETTVDLPVSGVGYSSSKFVEQDELYVDNRLQYNKVVKYINDVAAVHTTSTGSVYTEIYIYTPSNHGTTPNVIFNSISDDNYKANTSYQNTVNAQNVELIVGRVLNDVHPAGLSINAIYDYDGNSQVSENIPWFGLTPQVNTYITETNFNTANDTLIVKTEGSNTLSYFRNSLDGISIDWTLSDYSLIKDSNNNIENLNDFNSYIGSKSFEYNVILLYYDLVDVNNPLNKITNLFGVQFLNKVENKGGEFYIPYFNKYKPDLITKTSGNSLSHKFNIKGDSSYENVGVVQLLNTKTSGDYNTMSMDLFISALTGMKNMTDSYYDNLTYITTIKNELTDLKTLLISSTSNAEINARLKKVEDALSQVDLLFDSKTSLMDFIDDLSKKYDDIINNKTTIDVTYNLNPTKINNMIVHPQEFNLDVINYKNNIVSSPVLTLQKYTNYFKHVNSTNNNQLTTTQTQILSKSLTIKIDDTNVDWQYGQGFEIVFSEKLDPSIYNIYIVTDANNKLKSTKAYSKQIAILSKTDFSSSFYTPIFRIICIDPKLMIFEIDKIR